MVARYTFVNANPGETTMLISKHGVVMVLSMVLAACTSRAAITGAANNNSLDGGDTYLVSLGDLANGELVNIDRTHTVSGLPAELQDADYVLTANDDKTAGSVSVDVSFDTITTMYLSIDYRVGDNNGGNPPVLGGGVMDWVVSQGWQDTGLSWAKAEDAAYPFRVYTLTCLDGAHTFYEQNDGGSRNMYSIAAKPRAAGLIPYAFIDIGPNGQRVEAGGTGLSGAPANNANGASYGPTTLPGFTDQAVDFSISSVDWRDRGDATGSDALVRIGEDFVKHNDGTVTLTLAGLLGGRYQATSYHQDASNTQTPRIQVFVSDSISTNRLQTAQGDASQPTTNVNGLTTGVMTNGSMSFEFWSNGSDPVVLRFNGTPGKSNQVLDDETPVNGLKLELDLDSRAPLIKPFALIDVGPNGQRVVADGVGLPSAPGNGNNGLNYGPQNLVAANGALFSLRIDNQNTSGIPVGGIDWRDRGNSSSTQTLALLGEDHAKNNNGMIRVTLGGLPRGTYRIVSFHNDGNTSNNLQCEDVRVYITDANGVAVLQELSGDADHAAQTLNSITDQGLQGTASAFEIESNGSDDVIIYFDGTGATDKEAPLNGLRIEGIDVPSYGTIFSIR